MSMESTRRGSCDRALPMVCARSSSGSKCTAPGACTSAFAFSRETIRRCLFGACGTDGGGGSNKDGLGWGGGDGDGDGDESRLTLGEGVLIRGLYVRASSAGGACGFSRSLDVLALYAIGRSNRLSWSWSSALRHKGSAGTSGTSLSTSDAQSGSHWLTVRL